MSDQGAGAHHGIDYIEIGATDLGAAKRFYGAAFGWTFTDYGPEYTGFTDGARGEREAGGFRLVDAVSVGGPLVVLSSSDLESSAAAVRAAGGTMETPIFSFPGGRRFEFSDPSGNRLAVWSQA